MRFSNARTRTGTHSYCTENQVSPTPFKKVEAFQLRGSEVIEVMAETRDETKKKSAIWIRNQKTTTSNFEANCWNAKSDADSRTLFSSGKNCTVYWAAIPGAIFSPEFAGATTLK